MRHIAIIRHEQVSDSWNIEVSKFLNSHVGQGQLMFLENTVERSPRAEELEMRAKGHYGSHKQKGYPLVLVLDEKDQVLWACAKPKEADLIDGLAYALTEYVCRLRPPP